VEWEITVRIYLLRLDTSVGDAADAADGMTANRADAALKSPDRRTILLFEDEPDIRASLSDQMEDPSYRAIENGHRAMAPLYGTEHIDLLFTHIVMPGGLNGLDLARRVHKLHLGSPSSTPRATATIFLHGPGRWTTARWCRASPITTRRGPPRWSGRWNHESY